MPEPAVVWDAAIPPSPQALPVPAQGPWLLHTGDPLLLNAVLRWGLEKKWNVLLAPPYWPVAQAVEAARRHGATGVLTGTLIDSVWQATPGDTATGALGLREGSIGIFTSGTTGEPKLALHSWNRIRLPGEFAAKRLPAARWLMTYNPTAYAGLQVFFTALATGGAVIYPAPGAEGAAAAVREHGVEAISATPTWWRMLLAALPKEAVVPPLLQASLGGERVDQAVLETIQIRFNPRRLTHIYASTEAGSAIVVSDGRAGFPAAWLEDSDRSVRLRIRDGFLEIASPYRMVGYAGQPAASGGQGDWYRTPDLVSQQGDRVHFIGRSDTVANIGGAKVVLEEVEQSLMQLGWFSDCRVYTRSSPVTGTLLCAEVVPTPDRTVTIPALKEALATRLPRHAQPQLVKIVSSLQLSANGKKLRS